MHDDDSRSESSNLPHHTPEQVRRDIEAWQTELTPIAEACQRLVDNPAAGQRRFVILSFANVAGGTAGLSVVMAPTNQDVMMERFEQLELVTKSIERLTEMATHLVPEPYGDA